MGHTPRLPTSAGLSVLASHDRHHLPVRPQRRKWLTARHHRLRFTAYTRAGEQRPIARVQASHIGRTKYCRA